MLNNVNTNIERIIAKIDNDFNPDNSDWIPRVGAWCIDAMGMLNVLRKEKKKTKLIVKDRIAYSTCPIDKNNIKVYTKEGCLIKEADSNNTNDCDCNNSSFTGDVTYTELANTVGVVNNSNAKEDVVHVETVNSKDYSSRYNVQHYSVNNNTDKNYVYVDCNKLELNFDTNCIYVEQDMIVTEVSEIYNCELPVIPNNALLIEAITYYCMYKMLCRGYKHPVFNLAASQYGTNPYYQWTILKDEAERSVTIDNQGNVIDDNGAWRNSFYNFTFNPKG